jgi:CheY-like chemotaxis protein
MKNAFVIDDNRQTADALCTILKILGFKPRAAYGPGPAMAILTTEVPDLVFLDINMPGVTGFEILSYLRREPRLANVPVFVVTSDDQPQTRQRAMDGGASEVIIKPVMADVLEEALKKAGLM